MKQTFFIITAFIMSACSGDSTTQQSETRPVEIPSALTGQSETKLAVTEAFIRPPLPGRDIASAYFTINNSGQADRLIGANTSISDTVELHNHFEDNGVMKMRRIEGVDVAANEAVTFAPGGYHLMMFGTVLPDSASDVDITLIFEKGGEVTLSAPLESADHTTPKMDHSNH